MRTLLSCSRCAEGTRWVHKFEQVPLCLLCAWIEYFEGLARVVLAKPKDWR